MVADIQNPAQQRAGGFTHSFVTGVRAKLGGSDHAGATPGAASNNYILMALAPGDVFKRAVIIKLLEAYVGAGPAATSVSLVVGTAADGTGGTVVATLNDVRAVTPKAAVSTVTVDYTNQGATTLYLTARYTGLATATINASTQGLVGFLCEIIRSVDMYPQTQL